MAVLEIKPTYAQDGAAALLIHSNGFLGAAVNRRSNPCRGATRSGSNFLSPLFNGKSRSGRKVAPNIGDSCEFAASPAAATRRAGRLEGGHNGPNGPKSPFGLLGIPVI